MVKMATGNKQRRAQPASERREITQPNPEMEVGKVYAVDPATLSLIDSADSLQELHDKMSAGLHRDRAYLTDARVDPKELRKLSLATAK